MGDLYEEILNQLLFEIEKKNMTIERAFCAKDDIFCRKRDGFLMTDSRELNAFCPFDYVIVAGDEDFPLSKNRLLQLGLEEKQIVDGRIFKQARFDFGRYAQLLRNPVTILSDDCWGGYAYHRLNLPFSSPLINIYWNRKDFASFIQDPLFFLSTDLTIVREGNLREGVCPIASLGDNKKRVQLMLVHNKSFAEAREQWTRRISRINRNNLFIKMGFDISNADADALLKAFDKVRHNKILFYNGETNIRGAFRTERFIWRELRGARINHFSYNDFVRLSYWFELDLLKLLTGETPYSREEY